MDYRNREAIEELLEKYGSFAAAGEAIGLHRSTLARWGRRYGIISKSRHSHTTSFDPILSPVHMDGTPVTGRHSSTSPQFLSEVDFTRTDGWTAPVVTPKPLSSGDSIIILGDRHEPFREDALWSHMLSVVKDLQPKKIVDLGDVGDFPTPSRHRQNLSGVYRATVNQCTQGIYDGWRDIVHVAPESERIQLFGNHDVRIDIAVQEKLNSLSGIKRVDTEGWEGELLLDLPYICRFDELGVTPIYPVGEYHHASYEILPGLMGIHGTKAGKTGGASVHTPTFECSFIQGHDHKQFITPFIRYDSAGTPHHRLGISAGMMGRRDQGYVAFGDAQQGFVVVSVLDDGLWSVDLARYDDKRKVLYFRDCLYK